MHDETAITTPAALDEQLCLIGITGQAGTGKDTVADHLEDTHGFAVDSIAAPLYEMAEALLVSHGIDYSMLYERAAKEQPLPLLGISPRHLLQALGKLLRAECGDDVLMRLCEQRLGIGSQPVHDRICISDIRLASEADWVRKLGGKLVGITRAAAQPVRPDVTEQGLFAVDVHIANDGSIADLVRSANRALYVIAGPVEV